MLKALGLHDEVCSTVILLALAFAALVDRWRRGVRKRGLRLRASIRKLRRAYLRWRGIVVPLQPFRRRPAANRIGRELEEEIVRLHVGWPTLGAGRLRHVVQRVLGATLARETIRAVLKRNEGLIVALQGETRKQRRKIAIAEARRLWGMDLTLVWALGFLPVWVLGVVDYHGSRLVALEALYWPSTAEVVRVLERVIVAEGAPNRVITDRGSVFRSTPFRAALARHGVKQTLTKPHHPWTNGRIERLFRTFKSTIGEHFWIVGSRRQWSSLCADFVVFYNECRPHQSFGGLTPAEVHAGIREPRHQATPVSFFGGRMRWWRFS
jgi:transposase InsO family protein